MFGNHGFVWRRFRKNVRTSPPPLLRSFGAAPLHPRFIAACRAEAKANAAGGEGGIRTPLLKNADKYGLLRRSNDPACTTLLYHDNGNLISR
jgi:hypothetical protein